MPVDGKAAEDKRKCLSTGDAEEVFEEILLQKSDDLPALSLRITALTNIAAVSFCHEFVMKAPMLGAS